MLNKATFRPVIENFYFQRKEKAFSIFNFTILPLNNNYQLMIEIKSVHGFYMKYVVNIDEEDIDGDVKAIDVAVDYQEFVRWWNRTSAKSQYKMGLKTVNDHLYLVMQEVKVRGECEEIKLRSVNTKQYDDATKVKEISTPVEVVTSIEEAESIAAYKVDLDLYSQLNGCTIKQVDDHLFFLDSSGSSLQVFDCPISGKLLDKEEVVLPSVYLKNLVYMNHGVDITIGHSNLHSFIRFSTELLTIQFPVRRIPSECSVFNPELINQMKGLMKDECEKEFSISGKSWWDFCKKDRKLIKDNDLDIRDTVLRVVLKDGAVDSSYISSGYLWASVDISFPGKENEYNISCLDMKSLLDVPAEDEEDFEFKLNFSENDNFFVLNIGNRYVITPK